MFGRRNEPEPSHNTPQRRYPTIIVQASYISPGQRTADRGPGRGLAILGLPQTESGRPRITRRNRHAVS